MPDALLFAAKGDLGQAIIPIVFLLVWIIGAAARWFGQQQQQQVPPPARRPGNRPLQRASDAEIEEFVRQYVGEKPAAPPPPKTKPVRPKIGNTRPQEQRPAGRAAVESRHLHSQLEDRKREGMHSRLEGSHLHTHAVPTELTAMGIEGEVSSRRRIGNRFIGTMLDRGNIARAMVLGQVLQRPAGLEGESSGPLGPPVGLQH